MDNVKRSMHQLLQKGERINLECKKATVSVPDNVWETYSAFANTNGGTILLGIYEDMTEKDVIKRFSILGVEDAEKIRKDFWNQANNPQKISVNLLDNDAVDIINIDGKDIIIINVPRAKYNERPVYIKDKMIVGNVFKRNHEGDYKCNQSEINAMIRDANEDGNDGVLVEFYGMDDIDEQSLKEYRQEFRDENVDHPWNKCDDKSFLKNLGGYVKDRATGREGLTLAGLLMFGTGLAIRERFSNFRLDYIDFTGCEGEQRYRDRLTYDGRWENNLYQFFTTVSPKITRDLPRPFKLVGMKREDDTPQHKAVREAFTNSIIHSDVFLAGGILRIEKYDDKLCFRNPGSLKLSMDEIYEGGNSKARNPKMQDMLRMIGFGENLGSGFPKILDAWRNVKWDVPVLEDRLSLNEVRLTLPVPFGQKTHHFIKDFIKDQGIQLTERQEEILQMVRVDETITSQKISQKISRKNTATQRTIIKDMNILQEYGLLTRIGGKKDGHWEAILPSDVIES